MTVINESDFPEIVEIYNSNGRKAAYDYIRNTYGLKRPYFVIHRIENKSNYMLDKGNDQFVPKDRTEGEDLFMTIDELCGNEDSCSHNDTNPMATEKAMESLIHSLISDRLLELSKYITMETMERKIIIDKTSMKNDGYTVTVH